MIALIPHRAGAGTGHRVFDHAVLAETHNRHARDHEPVVTTVGPLSIVGDLRLWNRDGLRARAGGTTASHGMDDRRLLLEAYHRTGVDFLDDVDGDYAFVIWDNERRRVVAVRDRFGTKPLFFERTPSGIRFASEPKQLAATSDRPVEPCARSIVEYATGELRETRFSFFEGIERIRPSTTLIVDSSGEHEVRYWNPTNTQRVQAKPTDTPNAFRERLVDSVGRRLGSSHGVVSQLSGGLDSASIAAAASVLADRNRLPSAFDTASAVFPGHSIDESRWIREIAAAQPFPHHDFIPEASTIAVFDADMWDGDQPRVNRIRDLWASTAKIAGGVGADLVLTGFGGDQVLDQDQLLADRLGGGPLTRRIRDLTSYVAWSERTPADIARQVARDVVPPGAKRVIRRLIPRRVATADDLARDELIESLTSVPIEYAASEFDFPTLTQIGIVASTQHPAVSWINEVEEAEFATRGIDLSHPYLDRDLIEYIASISVADRPFGGPSKALVRTGFAGLLPRSVLDRRTKTVADAYLDMLFSLHGPQYVERYPEVTQSALPYLDPVRYRALIDSAAGAPPLPSTREALWRAWTLMAWIEGLARYRSIP